MLEESVPKKYLFLLLLCLCSIFLLSQAKELDKWKPLRRNEQDWALKAKEIALVSLSGEDSADNIFDGIRFRIKNFAGNLRLRVQSTVKYFSTKTPITNLTLLHRNATEGLLKQPFKRLRMRLKKRKKNKDQNHVLNMEPLTSGTTYEPVRLVDTGLAIVGTAMDTVEMFGNKTNSSNRNYTSYTNMTNNIRK